MSAPDRTTAAQNAINDTDLIRSDQDLRDLLRIERIPYRAVYKPGEVCRLLRISPTTLRQFCALAEPEGSRHHDPRALKSFMAGTHHRVQHSALVDWIARNRKTER